MTKQLLKNNEQNPGGPLSEIAVTANDDVEFLARLIEKCVDDGREDEAARIFEAADIACFSSGWMMLRWGRLAEMVGCRQTAEQTYKQALEDAESEPEALLRLGQMSLEAGNLDEAEAFFQKARTRGLSPEKNLLTVTEMQSAAGTEPEFIPLPIRDARLKQAVRTLLLLFRGKDGVYARQWYDRAKVRTGYAPIHEHLSGTVVEKHLTGAMTIGVYPLTAKGTVYFGALDVDIKETCLAQTGNDTALKNRIGHDIVALMKKIRNWSDEKGLPVVFEFSGRKGVHAWYFFEKDMPADFVIDLLKSAVACLGNLPEEIKIEVFPRQASPGARGYGNLIKLPLGVHRRSGKKSIFLTGSGMKVRDSIDYLLTLKAIPTSVLQIHYNEWAEDRHKRKIKNLPTGTANNVDAGLSGFSPQVGALCERCAMVGYLVRKAVEHHHLSFSERKVLLGIFGHLTEGDAILHNIMSQCSDYSSQITAHYISKLKGTALGCRKIRRMLFYLEGSIQCRCSFPSGRGEYDTPLLHLEPGEPAMERLPVDDNTLSETEMLRSEITLLKKMVAELIRSSGCSGGEAKVCSVSLSNIKGK